MGSPEKPIDVEMGDMSEEAKLNPNPEKSDVLVKENGELKEERFTGLKKEDLLKVSNEPKWVRARWVLFILFWIVWIGMLVGAILIVVNAPRCKPEPKQQWYQDTAVYEVNPKEFAGGLEGLIAHLPYIMKNLHVPSVLLTGANKESDPSAVLDDQDDKFKEFVDALHEENGKLLIDVVVDSYPVSSVEFITSSSASCATSSSSSPLCDLFVWKDYNETMVGWRYNDVRQASYKTGADERPVINYSSDVALTHILRVMQSWFDRGADGVKIRDISNLVNITQEVFVENVWNELFSNDTSRGLFIYSSKNPNAEINPVLLAANETNTAHSPVFLNNELPQVVHQNEAGTKMQNILENWREQSRNVGGFVVSPAGSPLAADRFGIYAAGLNLFSIALPGVPVLRSGDELIATSPDFVWQSGDARDSVPVNGSQDILSQTKALIVRRVAGIQVEQSLRYDTRDNDTTFQFLKVKNASNADVKDVIAFVRKWDKKDALLIVSNMSPNNHTVNLMVENGLMSEGKLAKKAKIVITSDPSRASDEPIMLEKVQLNSGTTLILK